VRAKTYTPPLSEVNKRYKKKVYNFIDAIAAGLCQQAQRRYSINASIHAWRYIGALKYIKIVCRQQ